MRGAFFGGYRGLYRGILGLGFPKLRGLCLGGLDWCPPILKLPHAQCFGIPVPDGQQVQWGGALACMHEGRSK